jgi:V/A-type H+-transporting ATPase subunit I
MRHVTLICRDEDSPALLEELRSFGAVHLHLPHRGNQDIEEVTERVSDTSGVLQKLSRIEASDSPAEGSPEDLVSRCQTLAAQEREIGVVKAKLYREARMWEPFGNIQPELVRDLQRQGLEVAFYRTPDLPVDLPPGTAWLTADPGFGVAVSTESLAEVLTPALNMPVRGPDRIRELTASLDKIQSAFDATFASIAARISDIESYEALLRDELDYLKAHAGMGSEESLAWIEGFIPEEQSTEIETLAAQWGAAVSTREPREEEPTPTLLKQNAFVSWIQPVFSFLGVTPGYNEVDVGWSFLIFLSLFSGMILGDAGYGVILLITVGLLNAFKPATRGKFANLLYLMGGATVLWGILTGNLFGMEKLPAVLDAVKIDSLADTSNPVPIMNLCFVLGAFHLTLAHGWNLVRNIRSLKALAELGWIGSTWTMYCISGQMVLGWESIPSFVMPGFLVSVALIVLFMTPPAKFKEQWVDHMMLPLSFVNNFVDVVSYVRLYAVGMATFALASSFNAMILEGNAERGLIASVLMILILILGHALNFVLAGMGVMVHGIRLNTLEFASHLGLSWSGIPYSPFRKRGAK